jgi:hypothetical protein
LEESLEIGEEVQDTIKIDGQEVYLGYIPSEDLFVSGWDMWENSERTGQDVSSNGRVYFRINENGQINIENFDVMNGLFYNNSMNGFEQLKRQYKDLINIRLD